jgi:hypothetical protein
MVSAPEPCPGAQALPYMGWDGCRAEGHACQPCQGSTPRAAATWLAFHATRNVPRDTLGGAPTWSPCPSHARAPRRCRTWVGTAAGPRDTHVSRAKEAPRVQRLRGWCFTQRATYHGIRSGERRHGRGQDQHRLLQLRGRAMPGDGRRLGAGVAVHGLGLLQGRGTRMSAVPRKHPACSGCVAGVSRNAQRTTGYAGGSADMVSAPVPCIIGSEGGAVGTVGAGGAGCEADALPRVPRIRRSTIGAFVAYSG